MVESLNATMSQFTSVNVSVSTFLTTVCSEFCQAIIAGSTELKFTKNCSSAGVPMLCCCLSTISITFYGPMKIRPFTGSSGLELTDLRADSYYITSSSNRSVRSAPKRNILVKENLQKEYFGKQNRMRSD